MELLEFTAAEDEAGVRIDRCLSDKYEDLSRSYLQKLLKDQGITVNGKIIKANYKVQPGDQIQVSTPRFEQNQTFCRKISLLIFFMKMRMFWWSISQRAWWFTHANGHTSGTLVNAILYHCQGNLIRN